MRVWERQTSPEGELTQSVSNNPGSRSSSTAVSGPQVVSNLRIEMFFASVAKARNLEKYVQSSPGSPDPGPIGSGHFDAAAAMYSCLLERCVHSVVPSVTISSFEREMELTSS